MIRRRATGRGPAESGQATVEAALTFPIVLIALLLIVQVGIVVRDALALAQAAREGARVAAVTAGDDETNEAVERSAGPLAADRIDVDITPPESERETGAVVTVRLSYVERLSIPIVSRILSMELPLKASATMRLERGHATPTPSAEPTPTATPAPSATPASGETPTPDPVPSSEPPPPSDPSPEPTPTPTPTLP